MSDTPHTLAMSVEELITEAKRITNISTIDNEIIKPLKVLHNAFNHDANMDAKSAVFSQQYLLRLLCNRLRMDRDFAEHPEINDEIILPPLFICGMARTGSTKMQKLLASSQDFNWLPFWQSLNPSLHTGDPTESPAARIKDTDDYVAWINEVAPLQKATHEYSTHEPEEESFVLMNSFYGMTVGTVQLPSFLQWLADKDAMTVQMKFLKKALQYLQWQGLASGSKRWILKAPFYFGVEPQIRSVFPDASFIMTHRHPVETTPSLCSFLIHFNRPVTKDTSNLQLFVDANAFNIEQHLQYRAAAKPDEFLDIFYKELTDSVSSVCEKVYSFINEPLNETSKQNMIDWDNNHPMHAKGTHKYSLADFDLTEGDIDQKFGAYITFLEKRFSNY